MRLAASLITTALLFGCQSSATTASSGAATAAKTAAPVCPITGKTVKGDGASAYYGVYEIVCYDREAANQFAALPPKKRAELAGPQVMATQGIINTTCPLTGKSLNAEAVAVKYDGKIYGFACLADANQFMALPKKKQAEIIAKFNAVPADAPAAKTAS